MADIAEMTGVSIATVSRVLNNNGRFSSETKQKVLSAVNEYNYQVNQSAKSLRTNKTYSIGIIVPDITNEFFARIVRSVETNIIPAGYTVFVCDSNENSEMEESHITSLLAKDVDGIIFISCQKIVKTVFSDLGIPVVYIDRRPEHAGTLISSDNEMGGFLATEELIKSGCNRILCLRDKNNYSTVKYRFKGYADALKKYGIEFDSSLMLNITVSYSDAKIAITDAVKRGMKFDGIFANNDMCALGAMQALRDLGIKVPDDVKVVGFDGITLTSICNPPMTTILQETEKFGEKAVEALLKLIENPLEKAKVFTIPVELIKRGTTENK